ncbi:MAG: Asp-tRNA(Asn)/Glu-tRNA(Gln) amidotransferase subunit GatA [archaeon]|nr:Asp-tRNA(Asn)/Glu-tRNA(Gln) amidotransferase subunit GatA [archaeon]
MNVNNITTINTTYRMFSAFTDKIESDAKFTFSVSDNLTSKSFETSAGSKILEGYRPPFDSTTIRRMKDVGGFLMGKTNMDEFGFGTFSVNSAFGIPRNPFDIERSCGGPSGGSACAAAVFDHVSLGTSIMCPASFCGVYGLSPSYGRVSRYGLIDCGNSFDRIGILSFKASALREYLPIIVGKDVHDPTSMIQPDLKLGGKKMCAVAVPKQIIDNKKVSKGVIESFNRSIESLKSIGIDVEYVDIPTLEYSVSVYSIIATSEASTDLARYCGMRCGPQDGDYTLKFDDYFTSFRSQYFGDEAKKRILLGTLIRMAGYVDKYYNKALRVRESIIADYKRQFERFDAIITPTMPFISPKFDDVSKMSTLDSYKSEFLTATPIVTGMPHLSVTCGYSEGMPIGLMFTSDHWNENVLVDMAERWDCSFDVKHAEVNA